MSCPYFSAERRVAAVAGHVAPAACPVSGVERSDAAARAAAALPFDAAAYAAELRAARNEVLTLLDEVHCNPILVRLAWHDSGTYDAGIAAWPACGGANGSIRFGAELAHNANAGLIKGVTVYLAPIAKRHPSISYADLLQLASATAVAHAGGPVIPMRYGRVDAPTEAQCPESGRLPDAAAPFGGDTPMAAPDAASHLRAVFYRMGFNDAEIVALSGAHTIGRAFKERSGTTPHGYTNGTEYTKPGAHPRAGNKPGLGMPGGQSWTPKWLAFDNSYFAALAAPSPDPALLRLATDAALVTDPGFRPHALRFAASQADFFAAYAAAHAKLSELGAAFRPANGVYID